MKLGYLGFVATNRLWRAWAWALTSWTGQRHELYFETVPGSPAGEPWRLERRIRICDQTSRQREV